MSPGPVAQKGLQHLGRADPVEDVDAYHRAPAFAEMRGQRLARRNAETQAVGARAGADLGMCEQGRVERRHAIEDGGAMTAQRRKHRLRGRPIRQQDGAGADRHGKGHGIAEAVGERQFRRGEHDVVLAQPDDALAHERRSRHQAGMHVPDRLGIAGRARRVHPECDLVRHGRRGERRRFRPRQQVLEEQHIPQLGPFLRARPDHDDRAQARKAMPQRQQGRGQRRSDDGRGCAAVRKQIGDIARPSAAY